MTLVISNLLSKIIYERTPKHITERHSEQAICTN